MSIMSIGRQLWLAPALPRPLGGQAVRMMYGWMNRQTVDCSRHWNLHLPKWFSPNCRCYIHPACCSELSPCSTTCRISCWGCTAAACRGSRPLLSLSLKADTQPDSTCRAYTSPVQTQPVPIKDTYRETFVMFVDNSEFMHLHLKTKHLHLFVGASAFLQLYLMLSTTVYPTLHAHILMLNALNLNLPLWIAAIILIKPSLFVSFLMKHRWIMCQVKIFNYPLITYSRISCESCALIFNYQLKINWVLLMSNTTRNSFNESILNI